MFARSFETIGDSSFLTQEAEKYYQTPGYQADVRQMQETLEPLTGETVHIDLEGVLVNPRGEITYYGQKLWEAANPDEEEFDQEAYDDVTTQMGALYVRRPLAQEFLDALANHNTVVVWTSLVRDKALKVIEAAGIKLPPGTDIIGQEENRAMLVEQGLFTAEEGDLPNRFHQAKIDLDVETLEQAGQQIAAATERIVTTSIKDTEKSQAFDLTKQVLAGQIKLATTIGVEILLDDGATRGHLNISDKLGLKQNPDNYLDVPTFTLQDTRGMEGKPEDPHLATTHYHRADRVLLDVSRQLVQRLTAATT